MEKFDTFFCIRKKREQKNRQENTEIYGKGCTLLKHLNTQSYITLKLLTLIKEAFMKLRKVTRSENIFSCHLLDNEKFYFSY